MKKKTGILTFHRPINFGAALQAVATWKYFDRVGLDVDIIDYRHERIENDRKLIGSRVNKSKSLVHNIKSIGRDVIDLPIEARRRVLYDSFVSLNTKMSAKCIEENIAEIAAEYDQIVIGSDLVWNWELDRGLSDVFFLNFPIKQEMNKVSYASSIGTGYIPENLKNRYREMLSKFNYLSVRETSAKLELGSIMKRQDIECVVDPTLLLSSKDWGQLEKRIATPPEYIFVYLLEQTYDSYQIVRKVAETMHLPVIYFSRKRCNFGLRDADKVIDIGPDTFLYLISHASLVITSSFHGMLFSVNYNTPFVVIPHSTRGARMIDFVEKTGMKDHLYYKAEDLVFENYSRGMTDSSQRILDEWICSSQDYITRSLL